MVVFSENLFMGKFRLFVLGQESSDPDNWIGDRAFAIARSAEEASALVDFSSTATEIPLDKPILLDHVFVSEKL
jgi:hypothetical protein